MISNMPPHGRVPTTCRTVNMHLSLLRHPAEMFVFLHRVGKQGSNHHAWERDTWPALKEITEKYPEAGIHFLGRFPISGNKDEEHGLID